ncbi:hypothetical protein BLNAU_3415 [Blattamonas nauphoetae]|uniref:Uncharacterized protein n=1 Tax=Blattamonas nauphoetae TaxID=2049346 RepID=A0ABQ9YCX6_9EUKA|nr:hypothetical protein BLNAU_3415 [Blattamonas nauphoetae]
MPCSFSFPIVFIVAAFNVLSTFLLPLFLLEVYTREWNVDYLIYSFVGDYESERDKQSDSTMKTLCQLSLSPDLGEPLSQTLQFSSGLFIACEVLNLIAGAIWLHHSWIPMVFCLLLAYILFPHSQIIIVAMTAFESATGASYLIRSFSLGVPPETWQIPFPAIYALLTLVLPLMTFGVSRLDERYDDSKKCVEKYSDCRRNDSNVAAVPLIHADSGGCVCLVSMIGLICNLWFFAKTMFGLKKYKPFDVESNTGSFSQFWNDCGTEMDGVDPSQWGVGDRGRYAIWTVMYKSGRLYIEWMLYLFAASLILTGPLVGIHYLLSRRVKPYLKKRLNVPRTTPEVEDGPSEDESELSLVSAELRELYRKVQTHQNKEMSATAITEQRELLTRAIPLDERFYKLTEHDVLLAQHDDPLSALSTLDEWADVVGLGLGRELFTVSSESSPDVQFRRLVQSIPVELERIIALFQFGEFSDERKRAEQDWLVWTMACWRVEILVSHFDDTIPLGRKAEKTLIHTQSAQMTTKVSEIEGRADSREYLSWREGMARPPSMVPPLPPHPATPSPLKVHPESPRRPPACPARPHPTRIVVVHPAPEVDSSFVSFPAERDFVDIGMPAEPVHSYSLRRAGGREAGRSRSVSWETVEMERTHIALHQNLSSAWRQLNQQRHSTPNQTPTITEYEAEELASMGRLFHQHTAELADTHTRTDPSTALLVLDKFDEVDVLLSESRGFTFRVPSSLTAEDQFSVLVRVQGKERRRIVEGLAHSNNVSDLRVLAMDGMRWEMTQRRGVVLFHLLKEKHKHSAARVAEIESMFSQLMEEVWAIEHSADVAGWENWEERARWLAR